MHIRKIRSSPGSKETSHPRLSLGARDLLRVPLALGKGQHIHGHRETELVSQSAGDSPSVYIYIEMQ